MDRLLDSHTDQQIASLLDERGYRSGEGHRITTHTIRMLKKHYGLRSRCQRLRSRGFLTGREMAKKLGVSHSTVKVWCRQGLLEAVVYDDKGQGCTRLLDSMPPGSNRDASSLIVFGRSRSCRIEPMRSSLMRSPCIRRSDRAVDNFDALGLQDRLELVSELAVAVEDDESLALEEAVCRDP